MLHALRTRARLRAASTTGRRNGDRARAASRTPVVQSGRLAGGGALVKRTTQRLESPDRAGAMNKRLCPDRVEGAVASPRSGLDMIRSASAMVVSATAGLLVVDCDTHYTRVISRSARTRHAAQQTQRLAGAGAAPREAQVGTPRAATTGQRNGSG
jgi:hypothetical protein